MARRRPRLGPVVVEGRSQLDARGAVDRGMVDLGEDGVAARGRTRDPVQALDQVHLPERPREVERARVQPRRLRAELAPVAGRRQREVAHVELEVEALVLDPPGVIEVERHPRELLPEAAREVQALLGVLQDALERDAAFGAGRWVVDAEARDVHRVARGLEVEEGGVEPGELLHGDLPLVGRSLRPPAVALESFSRAPRGPFSWQLLDSLGMERRLVPADAAGGLERHQERAALALAAVR